MSPRFIWEFVYGLGTERAWSETEKSHTVNTPAFRAAFKGRMKPWMIAASIIEASILFVAIPLALAWGLVAVVIR